ncbi:MAG TPA: hypothetical protein VFC99_19060 [Acidimicrobiia bacterium]|nr:hypothetical protein [Acidimicrobiia bacterium]
MPRRPIRNPARERDGGGARPAGRGDLGSFISSDGSAGRRRPLPAWLPEAPDPPPRGEDSAVRIIPFDEATTTPPVRHVHPVDEHGARLDAPPAPRRELPADDPTPPSTPAVTVSSAPAVREAPPSPPPGSHAPPRVRRVLGVNIDGGVAYLALVDVPDRVRLDRVDRLAPVGDLEPHAALTDFSTRFARLLRELEVDAVGIVRPLRYANWRYADAFARVSLETCIMVEASRQSLRVEWVGQQHAANVLGVPAERLSETLASRLGVERGPGWSKRSPALVVALAIANT